MNGRVFAVSDAWLKRSSFRNRCNVRLPCPRQGDRGEITVTRPSYGLENNRGVLLKWLPGSFVEKPHSGWVMARINCRAFSQHLFQPHGLQ